MLPDCLKHSSAIVVLLLIHLPVAHSQTSEPAASYLFPAGAQRGQTVDVTVGGLFLLNDPWFELLGPGVQAPDRLQTGKTIWFDGPLLTGQPAQQPDEYPKDHQAQIIVAEDTPTGVRPWRVWTSQGATPARIFVIGDLPEIVEKEIDGDPVPVSVTLPVTVNGRIFPRTDVDIWTFDARRGETYTIEVNAKSILSPLDTRIELRAGGRQIADAIGTQSTDPVIQFQARSDGPHQVHVHDVGYAGSQALVYRLTIREGVHTAWVYPLGCRRGVRTSFEVGLLSEADGAEPKTKVIPLEFADDRSGSVQHSFNIEGQLSEPVRLEISDLPEHLEAEPNNSPLETKAFQLPVMLNGRIDCPGDVDLWPIEFKAGRLLELRLSAGRPGSRLRPELAIVDSAGTVLAPTDAQPVKESTPTSDRLLAFTPTQDGLCWVRVNDRFPSRGGPDFGYRLQAGSAGPGFHLHLDQDAVTALRGTQASLPVRVERFGGLTGPISLEIDGLPAETESDGLLIPADQDEVAISLKPSETAPIGGHRLTVRGSHIGDDGTISEVAIRRIPNTNHTVDSVLFSISVATPFRFKNRGPYYARAHAGTIYRHPFTIERGDYDGPITVRVADRQRRHLQGVRDAGPFVVPAGVTDFEFPFFLPPGMSRDRLGRNLVMGIGEVVDEDGHRHQVVFTDGEQCQAPINVRSARISLAASQTSLYVQHESTSEIDFELQRDPMLNLPATVELIAPAHIKGIKSAPVTVSPDDQWGRLSFEIGSSAGPFNMPLTLRATVLENGDPVVGETTITIVTAPPAGN